MASRNSYVILEARIQRSDCDLEAYIGQDVTYLETKEKIF